MDKRKILMFIIILLILIIIFILIALNNINKEENQLNNVEYTENNLSSNNSTVNDLIDNNIIEEPSNEISEGDQVILNTTDYFDVKINSVYYAIKNVCEEFFYTINQAFDEEYAKQFFGENYYESAMKEKTEKLYALLGTDYINKNGITQQNINGYFSKYTNCVFKVEKIKEKIAENNICIFIVYGTINNNTTYNMAIVTDEINLNYYIYPYEYLTQNNIDNIKNLSIEDRKYNKIEYKDVSTEQLVMDHLSDYQYYAQNNLEKLYNKLDLQYSRKRFGALDKFKEYINDNISIIKDSYLKSYKSTRKGDYIQYDCIDNNGNHYIFKETAVMQYTLMLDNYTIMTEEELEYYNNLEKFDKSKYNLTKFISMVNTKDYNAIYNVLDITFRTNNFKTVEVLKEYIKNNLYNLNSIEIEDYDDETTEYYIFKCKVTNMKNNSESKNMIIIINQSEGTDFTMSFSFE